MRPLKRNEIIILFLGFLVVGAITLVILLTSQQRLDQYQSQPLIEDARSILDTPTSQPVTAYSQVESAVPETTVNYAGGSKSREQLIFEEGRDYYLDGDYMASMKTLRYLIRMYPQSAFINQADIYLGRCHLAIGRANQNRKEILMARDILITVLKRTLTEYYQGKPLDLDSLVDFVVTTCEVNRSLNIPNEEIEQYCEELLIQVTGEAKEQLYTCLGYLRLFKDNLDGAMHSFQQADTELAKLGRARVFVRQGDYPKAILIYETILNFHKDSLHYEEVARTFRIQTLYYAKQLHNAHEFGSATAYYNKLIEQFPDSEQGEDAFFLLGKVHWDQQEYGKAIRAFNRALNNKHNKRDQFALFYKAQSYYEQKKFEKALHIFNHLLGFYPQTPFKRETQRWIEYLQRTTEHP
jgi:tetratricopeptide (TPR) repeat protein